MVDRNSILDLNIVADDNSRINIDAFAEDAIGADYCLFAHLAVLPIFLSLGQSLLAERHLMMYEQRMMYSYASENSQTVNFTPLWRF